MKKLAITLFVCALYLTACNNATDDHGHEHGEETHEHEDGDHGHEHDEDDHHHEDHHQEEFEVGQDSTETEH